MEALGTVGFGRLARHLGQRCWQRWTGIRACQDRLTPELLEMPRPTALTMRLNIRRWASEPSPPPPPSCFNSITLALQTWPLPEAPSAFRSLRCVSPRERHDTSSCGRTSRFTTTTSTRRSSAPN